MGSSYMKLRAKTVSICVLWTPEQSLVPNSDLMRVPLNMILRWIIVVSERENLSIHMLSIKKSSMQSLCFDSKSFHQHKKCDASKVCCECELLCVCVYIYVCMIGYDM